METFNKALILLLLVITGCNSTKTENLTEYQEGSKYNIDSSIISLSYINHLHIRKTLKDYDETLNDYIKSNPNKPDSAKTTVYILPFGNMKPEVEEIIRLEIDYLEAFLQLPIKILDRVPYSEIKNLKDIKTRMVPDSDFMNFSKMKGEIGSLREQIEVGSFFDNYLIKNKPADAIIVLGITEHDIYSPKYNYLFGSSRLNDGIGLVSTFRLIDYRENSKYNIRKVISKQIVNAFSIKNVKDYECLLNFHISKEELEKGEFKISPRALEKLKYCIGFDYNKRFKDLEEIWSKEGNFKMVKYYKECQNKPTTNNI